ncbi:putative RNA-binding protein 19 [Penaeus vannamei]|uniref:Putative RNA-binding protein 19 n=1 Tax=Penaeus vannamei TaxID=6689 RepID=A0A3R7SNE0_PENVA|nr:putative RNA-binding protein 19 [Penaeus vannamei]
MQRDRVSRRSNRRKRRDCRAGHNWNTLFIGSGAVVDLMSEKYNRSKQEILNSEGKQSVAVNLALGETQIVDETKRFLEDSGISLDAFTTSNIKRSNTVILVKNLPAKTTAQELSQLFCRYGELGRVVLPPAGVTGVVEYLDPSEARKGFKNLAYSKFKYLPLYLEWAPLNVFRSEFSGNLHQTW